MRDTWTPFVLGPQDDWSKVTNGEDRKRIQNRLSQRARRAQLKAKRPPPKNSSTISADVASAESSPDTAIGNLLSLVDNFNTDSLFFPPGGVDIACPPPAIAEADGNEDTPTSSLSTEAVASESRHLVSYPKTPPSNFDQNFLSLASTSIIAAYISNATLLHISCTSTDPRTFSLTHFAVPTSLEPTLLQKTIPHPPVIDIIPFPGVRNRLLRSLDVIDLDKLSQDLVDGAFRVWGHTTWDGIGWEVSETFARRWWFLMDEQLINVTNFWRRQRFEGALILHNGEVSVET
ncbi:hypothetical protein V8C35DRAFT_304921 [Trichoderma chlorosporum]